MSTEGREPELLCQGNQRGICSRIIRAVLRVRTELYGRPQIRESGVRQSKSYQMCMKVEC